MRVGEYETNNVYCADSYKAIKQIPDNSIDCIYTDIPYLYCRGGGGTSEPAERTAKKRLELMGASKKYIESVGTKRSEALRISQNAKRKSLDYCALDSGIDYSIFDEFCRVLKKINIFIWCSKLQILDIMNYFVKEKACFFEILTWHKTNPMPTTHGSWLPDTEYCLYFRDKGVVLNGGYEYKSKYYISAINKRDKDKFQHPTCKPVPLIEQHLLHTTQPDDLVADFFTGGGSTCVACKNIGRQYLGFEIEQKWCNIAKNRLNNVDSNGQMSLFTF